MEKYIRKVQYHETDKMSITHHSNYIKWLEEARLFLLEKNGIPFVDVEARGIVVPVVDVDIKYRKTTTFGDTIEVQVKVEKYNGIKLEFSYELYNQATGELVTTAHTSHCFIKDGNICSIKKVDEELHNRMLAAME